METKQTFSNVNNFEQWLSHQLKSRGIKISQLARTSGVHYNTIRNYLIHRCEPTLYNVLLIIHALGYELEVTEVDNK